MMGGSGTGKWEGHGRYAASAQRFRTGLAPQLVLQVVAPGASYVLCIERAREALYDELNLFLEPD
jgi:hypothetical protein